MMYEELIPTNVDVTVGKRSTKHLYLIQVEKTILPLCDNLSPLKSFIRIYEEE